MPTFQVNVKELVIQKVIVEADTPEQAKEIVMEGQGDWSAPREGYDNLPADEWQVLEITDGE